MKLIKNASGKQTVKISKKEWENIGKVAGWLDESQVDQGFLRFTEAIRAELKQEIPAVCYDALREIYARNPRVSAGVAKCRAIIGGYDEGKIDRERKETSVHNSPANEPTTSWGETV